MERGFVQIPNLPYEDISPCLQKDSLWDYFFSNKKQHIIENLKFMISNYPVLLNVLIENRAYFNPYHLFKVIPHKEKQEFMKNLKNQIGVAPITDDVFGLETYFFTNRKIFYEMIQNLRGPVFINDIGNVFKAYSKELLCMVYDKLYNVVIELQKKEKSKADRERQQQAQQAQQAQRSQESDRTFYSALSRLSNQSSQNQNQQNCKKQVIDNFIIIDKNTLNNDPIIKKIKSGQRLDKNDKAHLKSLSDVEKAYIEVKSGSNKYYKSVDSIFGDEDDDVVIEPVVHNKSNDMFDIDINKIYEEADNVRTTGSVAFSKRRNKKRSRKVYKKRSRKVYKKRSRKVYKKRSKKQ